MKAQHVIAVDLDGTLAYYDTWKGIEHIGDPIPDMADRVRSWCREGKTVVIFTARIENRPEAVYYIREWLRKHYLPDLEITNLKRMDFVEMWDDRAVQIIQNTGRRADHRA